LTRQTSHTAQLFC